MSVKVQMSFAVSINSKYIYLMTYVTLGHIDEREFIDRIRNTMATFSPEIRRLQQDEALRWAVT